MTVKERLYLLFLVKNSEAIPFLQNSPSGRFSISHFQLPCAFVSDKTSLRSKPYICWNDFDLHMNGLVRWLVLTRTHKATRKWPENWPKNWIYFTNSSVANAYNIDIKLLTAKSSRRDYLKILVSKENTKYGVHQVSVHEWPLGCRRRECRDLNNWNKLLEAVKMA